MPSTLTILRFYGHTEVSEIFCLEYQSPYCIISLRHMERISPLAANQIRMKVLILDIFNFQKVYPHQAFYFTSLLGQQEVLSTAPKSRLFYGLFKRICEDQVNHLTVWSKTNTSLLSYFLLSMITLTNIKDSPQCYLYTLTYVQEFPLHTHRYGFLQVQEI